MVPARKVSRVDLVTAMVLAAGFVATAAVYARLPDPMPTHFGLDGRPNGWMSRAMGAWVLPASAVVVTLLVRFGARLLGPGYRERLEASPVRGIALATASILLAVHVLALRAALTPGHVLGSSLWVLLGAFFVVLGLLMPRTRRNPWIGVRTAWTLSSDENWARTHRVAGYSMTLGGLLVVCAGLVGARPVAIVAVILVSVFIPAVWSWHISRRGPGDATP